MTQTILVRFSYEDKVSQQVPIQIDSNVDFSKNSNRRKLMNRLLKSDSNITEVLLVNA
jgi:hypothetical protein